MTDRVATLAARPATDARPAHARTESRSGGRLEAELHEGLDSFELIRRDGTWRIVSIINERPTAENPLPDRLP